MRKRRQLSETLEKLGRGSSQGIKTAADNDTRSIASMVFPAYFLVGVIFDRSPGYTPRSQSASKLQD